ncbi:3-methyl-2-oxobutanoate hydroxymethyltransferase [Salinisphaera hydrothermalis]|uniref:3-methyl-2-oxobutanoate hydroxymethyltransferase n=1 Tax=Salinisphaera hydrothermalis (strain C41B8) TaxID=1304275 RepID=A0A084ILU0_SALHC|nr:3-methyl-2-oxobutanoate hydroxymethyltransferase [Salinisphaera hydrothermalis]KEZ77674.1 3-methyl-2-oxobutanoate hydroxymethyltransferase [Salinisphaera hydrothermalis C41B8]
MNISPYPHLQQQTRKPLTLADFARMKAEGEKIASLTCYDASFAALEDRAGVDLVLVGDSLGNVIQGASTTVGVSLDDMVYHSRITAAGLERAFLMTDLPFLTYATPDAALAASHRLMAEGQAKMVKIEGGAEIAETVSHLTTYGVPVCAHMGLRPQLVHKLGGFKVQGRDDAAADAMVRDARLLEEAGADMLLLECVPSTLAARITAAASVPVIGIGAGPDTDGQILVIYDILGLSPGRKPRFVKNFMADADCLDTATADYVAAVKDRSYPAPEHGFK